MGNNIGNTLKKARIENGYSVEQVSSYLTNKGYKALEKTVYSWESGNSQPKPDILLELCSFYGIKNVLETFGYESGVDDNNRDDQPHTIAAHFDGDDYTEAELDKIKEFADFVKNSRK